MFYTHERFMDVFFFVWVKYQDHKRVKLKVEWWYKGQCGEPFIIKGLGKQSLTLTPKKWSEFIKLGMNMDYIKHYFKEEKRGKVA